VGKLILLPWVKEALPATERNRIHCNGLTQSEPVADAVPAPKAYETTADVAKKIRTALKEKFPATKFSVRSSNYSMGSSISVSWTDGPTVEQVKPITDKGASIRRDHFGEILNGGNRFVDCDREISPALKERAMERCRKDHGRDFDPDDGNFDNYLIYCKVVAEMQG
jgi:hypothetical protein